MDSVIALHAAVESAGSLDLVIYHRGPVSPGTDQAICSALLDRYSAEPLPGGGAAQPRLRTATQPAPLEWAYRDLDRLHQLARRTAAGHHRFELDPGRVRLQPDFQPLADLAHGRILADPSGELTLLQHRLRRYPRPLADGLVVRLWQTSLLIEDTRRAADHADTVGVAGGLTRIIDLTAHALHGHARRWPPDPVKLLAATQRLDCAPPDFSQTTQHLLSCLGSQPRQLHNVVDATSQLVRVVAATCRPRHPD